MTAVSSRDPAQEPGHTTAVSSPHLRYREGLPKGILLFQRCPRCASAVFPPRLACPGCGSAQLASEQSAGAGTIYSVTVVTRSDGSAYSVCLIDMDEGFRMMSTVHAAADQVSIGRRVIFAPESGDAPRAAFAIAGDG